MCKKILFVMILIGSSVVNATIHVYTNTSWSNLSFSQDIVVHPGAKLTLSGNIVMAPDKSITILDQGMLYCHDGQIVGMSSGPNWQGILVEQTPNASPSTTYAVETKNFRIANAKIGIYSLKDPAPSYNPSTSKHNRMMNIRTTVFEDNDQHLKVFNLVSGSIIPALEAYSYSVVFVKDCEFKTSTNVWPVHMIYCKSVTFMDCTFNGISNEQITLHQRSIVNGLVYGCYFAVNSGGTLNRELAYHGECKNNTISSNTFYLTKSDVGIDLGHFVNSEQENMTISNNEFITTASNTVYGIAGLPGNSTSFENLKITQNEFTNLTYGVYDGGFLSGNEISKNIFTNCSYPLYFYNSNPGVRIFCNTFDSNSQDITIAAGASLQNQNYGYDSENTWSTVTGHQVNIKNNGTVYFHYHYKTNYPITPPIIFVPNYINLIYVSNSYNCDGGGGGESRRTPLVNEPNSEDANLIQQYPNPATTQFEYSLNNLAINELTIINTAGQIVYSTSLNQNNGVVNIENLENGLYFCLYSNHGNIVAKKKLVVQ